jgi:hypothetical protein
MKQGVDHLIRQLEAGTSEALTACLSAIAKFRFYAPVQRFLANADMFPPVPELRCHLQPPGSQGMTKSQLQSGRSGVSVIPLTQNFRCCPATIHLIQGTITTRSLTGRSSTNLESLRTRFETWEVTRLVERIYLSED